LEEEKVKFTALCEPLDADMELIETRLAISHLLKATRQKKKLTQATVEAALHTSQSRLAKMESGDPSYTSYQLRG
jgi:DNA-binding transcriptional regulator YiaG